MGHAVQFTEPVTFEKETCINCGLIFFIPADVQAQIRRIPRTFYCPNGHTMVYSGDALSMAQQEAKDLRERLAAETKRKEWAELDARQQREQADKLQREAKKLKKRIAAGVCPCCHRTVSQMARHIKTKHPEYSASKVSS